MLRHKINIIDMKNIHYKSQKPSKSVKKNWKINCEIFQAESVKDAAFGCDWVGTAIPFQRCLMFIIATANKGFQLTAGKFVPVSNLTMINVGIINILYFFHGSSAPNVPGLPRCWMFYITLRLTTVGRNPLDNRSARRRRLYLITRNTHKRHTLMIPVDIETLALDHAPTEMYWNGM